ncbi:MAG: DUF433 domain-containing protein [Pirellulaceae bacterium]
MPTLGYAHIMFSPVGTPLIAGTTTKVLEVALDYLAHHWDVAEIQRQHPHLSRGQIHSALAYYFDHEVELNEVIARQLDDVDRLRSQAGPSPVVAKIRSQGRLP